ncbi:protein of unknown function [Paraburkholderia dioscoreae]|uniref:Uncharacterized protein n=1 Tax=Paraburkholderia dioscoreae TaxID=2604047 RepID=A0A5Q4ZVI5_9BURK|nr:protein of unknown function [Paraburkholderia dioscoreae]
MRSGRMRQRAQLGLIALDSTDVLAERRVRGKRQRAAGPEHCASNAGIEHRFQENSFEVKRSWPRGEPVTNGKLGARLAGGAGAAFTRVKLRECVYGVMARNFRDRGDAL